MKATKTEDRSGEFGACWSFPNGATVEQHLDGIDTGILSCSYSRYVVDHYSVMDPDPNTTENDRTFHVHVYGSWRTAQNAAFAHARSL